MEPVSIIMKVWNAPRMVRFCLKALLKNTGSPFELIIIDNGSDPPTKAVLSQVCEDDHRVRVITNAENQGPGRASRQGFAAARYDTVCLMDSDVLVPEGWLERLLADFQRNPDVKIMAPMYHEETLAYPYDSENRSCREVWFEARQQSSGRSPLDQFLIFSRGKSIEAFDQEIINAIPAGMKYIQSPPDFVSTCCVLMDRAFVESAGGAADPDFRGYGSEDVDLCWRIGEAGGRVARSYSVYVHHFQGASLDDNRLNRAAALAQANRILYQKWHDRLLELVIDKTRREGVDLLGYLESHFIFSALAQHTPFMSDLRDALQDPGLPDILDWHPL
jgi:GT2 family glycosyltransferase